MSAGRCQRSLRTLPVSAWRAESRGERVFGEIAVGTIPFDTLATIYELQASAGTAGGAPALAVASWMAVIHGDLERAAQLAAEARRRADEPVATLTSGLANMVDVLRGRTASDGAELDRIRTVLLEADTADPVLSALEVMLEVANWFTFCDRHADAAHLLDRRLIALRSGGQSELGLAWTLTSLAELDLRRGRWQRCVRLLDEVIDGSERAGDGAGYTLALAAARRSRPGSLRRRSRTSAALPTRCP